MEARAIMVTFSVAFCNHHGGDFTSSIPVPPTSFTMKVYLMNRVLLAKCSCLMMMTLTLKAAFLGIPMIPICHHHIGALSQTLAL